jgi:hypothetical protein
MSTPATEGLAVAACALLAVAAVFQLGLAAGAPWAAAAYGGRKALPDGRLPTGYRVGSLLTAVVLMIIGGLLLARGGVLGSGDGVPAVLCWALAVLFALNTLGNLAGRHPVERWGMGAVTACLTVLWVLLAVG